MLPRIIFIVLLLWICFSCNRGNNIKEKNIIIQWENKEIIFPDSLNFVIFGKQNTKHLIHQSEYKIVQYVNSSAYATWYMQLADWKTFMSYLDSITNKKNTALFFLHSKRERSLIIALKQEIFNYPVYFDKNNQFYELNKLPTDMSFQTFLINKENKIVAVGNPLHRPKIKELYIKILTEKEEACTLKSNTVVNVNNSTIDFGFFYWNEKKDTVFTLENKGNLPLTIYDVKTSCGCTIAQYPLQPVLSGEKVNINVSFRAEHPEVFHKTIAIYCNTNSSPIVLHIKGQAISM